MKIYAFTDLHGNTKALAHIKEAIAKGKPDLIVCTGDLSVFEHELEPLLSRINMLKVQVVMLHGNHEGEQRMRKACAKFERITFLHKDILLTHDWTFVAYGGGGFEDHYPELEELMKSPTWKSVDWQRTVFLSHAPPHGTTLDDIGEGETSWHVGSKSLTALIKKFKPRLVLAGHIHECFNAEDKVGKTTCINPGPNGRMIDLEKL